VPGGTPGLAAGLRATVRAVVTGADTAEAMGSGNLPVLATPRLLALAEAATVAAVAPQLADGLTTVGTAVSLEHRKASPLGAEIVVEAELTEVDGRRLVFGFIARPAGADAAGSDADGTGADGTGAGSTGAGSGGAGSVGAGSGDAGVVVGAGTVERVVVDGARFLARAQSSP
jgi:fluoroacetyl-CoA thioesterase